MDGTAAAQLVEDSGDVLFSRIQNSAHHVLHELLPHPSTHDYELRPRRHNLSLTSLWDQRNFVSRNPVLQYWAAGLVPSGIYNRKGTLNRSFVDILHPSLLVRVNRDA